MRKLYIILALFLSLSIAQDYSLSFDGVDDYVSTNSWLSGENNTYSLSVTFRLSALANEDWEEVIIQHRGYYKDKGIIFLNDGTLAISDRDSNNGYNVFYYTPELDTWYNIVLTADDDFFKLYVNGSLIETQDRNNFNSNWSEEYSGSFIGGGGIGLCRGAIASRCQ